MTDTEGRAGKDITHCWVDVALKAAVRRELACNDRRDELLVHDLLKLGDVHDACVLVQQIAGQGWDAVVDDIDQSVVLAHEEGVHSGEHGVLICTLIAGQEKLAMVVGGVLELARIEGHHGMMPDLELSVKSARGIDVAQSGVADSVRAVDGDKVDSGGEGIDGTLGGTEAGATSDGAHEGEGLDFEAGVVGGDLDIEGLLLVLWGEGEVVVEELAEKGEKKVETMGVDSVGSLGTKDVGYLARGFEGAAGGDGGGGGRDVAKLREVDFAPRGIGRGGAAPGERAEEEGFAGKGGTTCEAGVNLVRVISGVLTRMREGGRGEEKQNEKLESEGREMHDERGTREQE